MVAPLADGGGGGSGRGSGGALAGGAAPGAGRRRSLPGVERVSQVGARRRRHHLPGPLPVCASPRLASSPLAWCPTGPPPLPRLFFLVGSPQKMSALQLNLAPLKEPLGFIKLLQWIFSIFAFATCGGYSGKTVLLLRCPNHNFSVVTNFAYPFRLNKATIGPFDAKTCNASWNEPVFLVGDFSSSAQFFVTFAVLVFLYCMAALVLYVGYLHLYRGAGKLPMLDFVITVVIAFLWLVSTSAWAKALTDIKRSTGPSMIDGMEPCMKDQNICHFDEQRSLGSLNVSVVIGFLNLILWAGNAWFVYKETSLHQPPPTSPPNPADPGAPSGM